MAIIGLSTATQLLGIIFPAIREYWNLLWSELQDFFGHYIIVLLALIMTWAATSPWFQREWAGCPRLTAIRRRSRHGFIIVLVLAILAFSEFKTNRVVRERTAQDSRARAEQAYTYTQSQLQSASNPDLTDQLVILSQGIGQITTRTFDLIQSSHPEYQLRAISIHIKLTETRVEDLIQEGEFKKDRTIFPMDGSLVGATIKEKKPLYCPDLSNPAQSQYTDCQKFHSSGAPKYASLICYPISLGFENDQENVFAAICLDSIAPHAFDNAIAPIKAKDETYETIKDQMAQLATLLRAFQVVRTRLQSGKEGIHQRSSATQKVIENNFRGIQLSTRYLLDRCGYGSSNNVVCELTPPHVPV